MFLSAGYDGNARGLVEEDDSAYPALLEREFHTLHRNMPGLRRSGLDTTAIRQVSWKKTVIFVLLYFVVIQLEISRFKIH